MVHMRLLRRLGLWRTSYGFPPIPKSIQSFMYLSWRNVHPRRWQFSLYQQLWQSSGNYKCSQSKWRQLVSQQLEDGRCWLSGKSFLTLRILGRQLKIFRSCSLLSTLRTRWILKGGVVRTPDDVRINNFPCNLTPSKNVTPYANVYVRRNRKVNSDMAGACGPKVGKGFCN